MGVDEPIDPRCDNREFCRWRTRRMIKKNRITSARRARKPRTTMTAIAQWGNEEFPFPDCTFPLPEAFVDEGLVAFVLGEPKPPACDIEEARDAEDAAAAEADAAAAEAADRDDAAAADVEDIDAMTESAKVVSESYKTGTEEA